MNNKNIFVFIALFINLNIGAQVNSEKASSLFHIKPEMDYMTIDEAIVALKIPKAAAKLASNMGESSELPNNFRPPFTSIEPVKLFDNFYFVGTTSVGAFVADTKDGLVMFDTGCGDVDVAMMVADMRKLGLDPATIKLIFISHEHMDHYGGVQYLKKNVCPDAKVALSLLGWNMLQTVPMEGAYIGKRPQSVDVFLTDGMKIKVGNTIIQIVATPGHSAGCMSFIIPVTDNGEPHVVGIMGGMYVFPTQIEAALYKTSVEYFKAFTLAAKCDIGLGFHSRAEDFTKLRCRKPNEANPLIIGTEKFDTVYLQMFRNKYQNLLHSGDLKPY